MATLISSVLGFLVLLAISQAADPSCKDLTKPLVLEDDYSSMMGKWIFTEGIANHPLFTNILLTVNSSWVEFAPSSLKDTVILSQGNMLNGKCEFTTINATVKNNTFFATEKEITSEGDFLPSCSGCLTMHFTSQINSTTINTLYLFTKAPKAPKSDMDQYWKQAECLGFKKEPQFSYDGVKEFCQEEKNNSSKEPKPEDKNNE
ncbi:saxitoxin and tetrodotoxin-binding protein 2-like [Pygocentrus nattereri]|uniref:Apolipoprotein M n=1 Tax=Pygocentrus nattereri TaxID=42514 RepID=A0AAR2LW08_PYGNA|nr:saxitoxin and tetrodotoxin-binding protein 2-like [Pygocentrus nattereri]